MSDGFTYSSDSNLDVMTVEELRGWINSNKTMLMSTNLSQRLLITGGSGLLAVNWAYKMRHRFDVHLLLHKRQINIEGVQCHLLDWHFLSELRKIIEKINPSIIINAVALTDVDNCEKIPRGSTQNKR